jgi:predicted ABC-type transport system involved in lysophospholipase L1 biosynthesis ATPase subunit
VADEPTGNLDSRTGEEILAEFGRLNRDLGQTLILVTHDPAVAAHAARLVRVADGRIVADRAAQPAGAWR